MANQVKAGKLRCVKEDLPPGKQPNVKELMICWTQFGVIAPLTSESEKAGRPTGDSFGKATWLIGHVSGPKDSSTDAYPVRVYALGRDICLERCAFVTVKPCSYVVAQDPWIPIAQRPYGKGLEPPLGETEIVLAKDASKDLQVAARLS